MKRIIIYHLLLIFPIITWSQVIISTDSTSFKQTIAERLVTVDSVKLKMGYLGVMAYEFPVTIGEWDLNGDGVREKVIKKIAIPPVNDDIIIVEEDIPRSTKVKSTNYTFPKGWLLKGVVDTDGLLGMELLIQQNSKVSIIRYKQKKMKEYEFGEKIKIDTIVNTDNLPGMEVVLHKDKKPGVSVIHDFISTTNDYPTNAGHTPKFLGSYSIDDDHRQQICYADTISKKKIGGTDFPLETYLLVINDSEEEQKQYFFGRGDTYIEEWNLEGVTLSGLLVISWKQRDFRGNNFTNNYRGGYRLISYNLGQQKKFLVYSHMMDYDPTDFVMETEEIAGNSVYFSFSAKPKDKTSPVSETGIIGW